ncbi:hypothetical protein SXIM_09790 [Streptomyces xiamenensis]|uniref:Uncharacterized protein n=1 Tax=Streptomyces xiamenensis TaxID=408015 RepID=A0A0F7FS49_9ACTN|nr:hypothetical protein SXIM_09790 [Streptomyces xiamenensis]
MKRRAARPHPSPSVASRGRATEAQHAGMGPAGPGLRRRRRRASGQRRLPAGRAARMWW